MKQKRLFLMLLAIMMAVSNAVGQNDAVGLRATETRTGSNSGSDALSFAVLDNSGSNNTFDGPHSEEGRSRYTATLNSNSGGFSYSYTLFSYQQTVPAYARLKVNFVNAVLHMYNNASQAVPSAAALYIFDSEANAKNANLVCRPSATKPGNPAGGTIIGYAYNPGNQTVVGSSAINNVNYFDNRNGSSNATITKYLMFTVCATNGARTQTGHFLVEQANNAFDSKAYDYYMHITYNANGGSGSMAVQTVENSGMLSTCTFTAPCKRFKNWNSKADGSGTSFTQNQAVTATATVKGPVTLYAQWEDAGNHTYNADGKCTKCGINQPAELVNGYYEINNAGKLTWFRDKVNSGSTTINGKLTADINLNNANWTKPIGYIYMTDNDQKEYKGTFDGQGHTISNVKVTYTEGYDAGLFGRIEQNGSVKNLIVNNATISGNEQVGGIAGECANGSILNCAVIGTVTLSQKVSNEAKKGAVIGESWGGTISNCYTTASKVYGGLVNNSNAKASNCFTSAQANLANGEMCYKLNGNQSAITWYQTLGQDTYPVPSSSHSRVYMVDILNCAGKTQGKSTYTNTNANQREDHNYENGICSKCHENKVPQDVDGVYEIATLGELTWFRNKVNSGSTSINGKLTANIDFATETWNMPIGYYGSEANSKIQYRGTFDGQGFTISNVKVIHEGDNHDTGLFGRIEINCIVKNLIVQNATIQGKGHVGAIAGENVGGFIIDCAAIGNLTITDSNSPTSETVGAIVGEIANGGTVSNCYTTSEKIYGKLVNNNTVSRCYTPADANIANGEMCYLLNGDQTEIVWRQNIGTDTRPVLNTDHAVVYTYNIYNCEHVLKSTLYSNTNESDQVEAHNYENGICSACHQNKIPELTNGTYEIATLGELAWFRDQVNSGLTSINGMLTTDIYFNDVVWDAPIGYFLSNDDYKCFEGTFDGNGKTVRNVKVNYTDGVDAGLFGRVYGGVVKNLCVLNAEISGNRNVGAVAGECLNAGQIQNCCALGTLTFTYTAAPNVAHLGGVLGDVAQSGSSISGCYSTYSKVYGAALSNSTATNCYAVTVDDPRLISGEICYLLNGDQTNIVWRQTIGTDDLPVFENASAIVYRVNVLNCLDQEQDVYAYSNTNEDQPGGHNFKDGVCTVCGYRIVPKLVDGVYEIGNFAQLTWFRDQVNGGLTNINGKLIADIDFGGETWTMPIGHYANTEGYDYCQYRGTFDGQGHTISNVKIVYSGPNHDTGLFGRIERGTIKNFIVYNADITVSDNNRVGVITGENVGGHILNCAAIGTNKLTQGRTQTTCPFVGQLWEGGTISDCYTTADRQYYEGSNNGTVSNYHTVTADDPRLATGELCYLLNGDQSTTAWRQNLGEDSYPVPNTEHSKVRTFKISSVGYATYSDAEKIIMPEGVLGQVVKEKGGEYVTVTLFEGGDIVPAETGLLLKGTAGTYYFNTTDAAPTNTVNGNLLHAALEAKTTDGGGVGAKYYKLANGANGIGWYYGSANNATGAPFQIDANKAYLVIEAGAQARAFISLFEDDNETSLQSIIEGASEHDIYNLSGQRIHKMQKGINIVNGKKVMF